MNENEKHTHMQQFSHGGTFDQTRMHFMINNDGMVFGT
jgi:hypothetical protein